MVDGYSKWDLFRHREALNLFDRAKMDDIAQDDDERIRAFALKTAAKTEFLKKAISSGNDGKIPCLPYLIDLYANAERRFAEGKFDDAILRIYRIVELAAQERLLCNHSIITSDVKQEQIPERLREEFVKQYKNPRDQKIKVPLEAGFSLLNAFGDELGVLFEEKKTAFRKIQSARNSSFLAHGFESAKDLAYLSLRDFVLSLKLFRQEDAPVFPVMRL
jgi:CRISPR-associated protein (TIGR02710 family)